MVRVYPPWRKRTTEAPGPALAAARLDELRPRALQRVELDSRSYDAVTAAYAMLKADDRIGRA